MAMTTNNVGHLFQRCPCKMMSKPPVTVIHMYMDEGTLNEGCMGLSKGKPPLFVSCPQIH